MTMGIEDFEDALAKLREQIQKADDPNIRLLDKRLEDIRQELLRLLPEFESRLRTEMKLENTNYVRLDAFSGLLENDLARREYKPMPHVIGRVESIIDEKSQDNITTTWLAKKAWVVIGMIILGGTGQISWVYNITKDADNARDLIPKMESRLNAVEVSAVDSKRVVELHKKLNEFEEQLRNLDTNLKTTGVIKLPEKYEETNQKLTELQNAVNTLATSVSNNSRSVRELKRKD